MRSRYFPLAAMAFVVGCADTPVASLLEPGPANFSDGRAPPPWAMTEGEVTTDGSGEATYSTAAFSRAGDGVATMSHSGNAATYRAWLLVTPRDNAAILRFLEEGTNVRFSKGAMIMKVNGKVSGKGTMTVGGHAYDLSAVDNFEANGACATSPWDYAGPPCATFSDNEGSFSSQGSVWTGVLSSDGSGRPPRWDCGKECVIICPDGECFISTTTGGKR